MSDFIIRKNADNRFTHLSNELLQDSPLSFKALGMLVFLLSLPPNFLLNMEHLANKGKSKGKHGCGRDGVRAIIKELQEEGYLRIDRVRVKGKFISTEWFVTEVPRNTSGSEPQADIPLLDKPPKVKPLKEKPPLQRIIHTNNESNKLLLPRSLAEPERKALVDAVSKLPIGLAQDILDEAMAIKRLRDLRKDLISLVHGLVRKANAGSFNLSLGYHERALRGSNSDRSINDKPGKTNALLKDRLKEAGISLGRSERQFS
jgi:hypothetical protein